MEIRSLSASREMSLYEGAYLFLEEHEQYEKGLSVSGNAVTRYSLYHLKSKDEDG